MDISFSNSLNHLKKPELSNVSDLNSNSKSNQLNVEKSQDIMSVNENITKSSNLTSDNINSISNNAEHSNDIVPSIKLQHEPVIQKKRGRGRPRKYPLVQDVITQDSSSIGMNQHHLEMSDSIKVNKVQKARYKRRYKSKSKSKTKTKIRSVTKSSKLYRKINNHGGLAIKKKKLKGKDNNAKENVGGEEEEEEDHDDDDEIYGILEERNIKQVQFGLDKLFPTWYGSAVYFDKENRQLGIYSSKNDGIFTNISNNKIINNEITNCNNYMDHPLLVTNSDKKDRTIITDSILECTNDKDSGKTNNEKDDNNDNNDSNSKYNDDSIWLDTLYVCEYCFKYTNNPNDLKIHDSMCKYKLNNPPGKIKYRSPVYTIRRVKGYKEKLFCQCLCLFTKLFLDNKSTYFKVENYEFYILYKTNERKPMAFFSKDVLSYNQNNLACILTFPPYQRQRLGSLLIEFSYKLSRSQDLISGPEFPLSPFGLVGYINYWAKTICWHLLDGDLNHLTSISIKDISLVTGFRISDIIMTLKYLNCIDLEKGTINIYQIKYWINSRNKRNDHFMLKDEYLMITD